MPGVPVPPGFVRPDPPPGSPTPTLSKSRHVVLNDGKAKDYPTRADLVARLVADGVVQDEADLLTNHRDVVGEMFFTWIEHGQIGCLFAVRLSKNPREHGWLPIVYTGAVGPDLGAFLNTQLDPAIATHEAAAVIFPHVNTDEEIVELVNCLCADPSGRWYHTTEIDEAESVSRLIHLRWVLPTNEHVNYALGFADTDRMPLTRRAPFTALFLRVKGEKRTPEHRENGRVQVHLADLDSQVRPQDRHDKVWTLTEQHRRNHVEPEKTAAARARVTFAVDAGAVGSLCKPTPITIAKHGGESK